MISIANYEAILFDLDGTLVDTMPLHYAAYAGALQTRGLTLDWVEFMNLIGPPAKEVIPLFVKCAGGYCDTLEVAKIHNEKKEIFSRILQGHVLKILPAARFLPAIKHWQSSALVTSGNRRGAEAILEKLNWDSRFDTVVTGDDVTCGKPDPEPFLLAAKRLDVLPARCIVFEDTTDGVASARAAGMAVVNVTEVEWS